MGRKKFEATEGLLHDDIRKQAGSIEKSWLEAVMNAVDAKASKVSIDIGNECTVITDNGTGLTEDEIDKYFKQFGYKDSDQEEKEFGKFRRGRGQLFAYGANVWHTNDNLLVVNLDEDKTEVGAPVHIDEADDAVEEVENGTFAFDTHGLGFNQQPASVVYDGTKIEVHHFKEIEDVDDKISKFKRLVRYIPWLHDIEVEVNGEKVRDDFESDFTTEYAHFQFGESSFMPDAAVYNMGAYVSDYKIKDDSGNRVPISGVIVSKEELDLNNARNDIIEGDETWEQIKDDYILGARYHLANKDDLTDKEVKWLITQASEDEEIFEMVKGREIIKDIEGNKLALEDLEDSDAAFAPSGNALAKEAMDRKGMLMIDEKFKHSIEHLTSSDESPSTAETPSSYEDVVDKEMQFEMKEREVSKLTKRRRDNLKKLKWFLREIDCYDELRAGFSKHEDVWKDDEGIVYVDEDFLNANKMKLATEVVDKVVEIVSSDNDTRRSLDKNSSYYRSYHRYMNKSTEARKDLLNGNIKDNDLPMLV